jgi:threonine aldolase
MYTPAKIDPSLPPVRINLYSDTQTRPTRAMRAAMMEAEVGDDQSGSDPTINALCERMAALLGKEAAVFLPSGTMANEIAILVECRPGDEILAHELAHIYTSEGGAPWALAGVQVTGLPGAQGRFSVETLAEKLRPAGRNFATQRMVEVEQTANLGGGAVWPLETLQAVAELAHSRGMATMMDGARLMNAVVASGVPAHEMVAGYDSVWLDFTKGLGAPLGAVLAGSAAFIDEAWRWKQRMGGAMRQAGICAAACLYALDHNVDRLAEDHENARLLARGLAQIPGIEVGLPDTNLVFFDVTGAGLTAEALSDRLRQRGILISTMGRGRCRACLHLDVSTAQVQEALAAIRDAVA